MVRQIIVLALITISLIGLVSGAAPEISPAGEPISASPKASPIPAPKTAPKVSPQTAPPPKSTKLTPAAAPKAQESGSSPVASSPPPPFRGSKSPPWHSGSGAVASDEAPADAPSSSGGRLKASAVIAAGTLAVATYMF